MLSIASAAFAFQGSDLVTKFNEWKLTHAKTYASSDAEASALAAYASNEAIINEHNGKGSSYELGHNEFSDLTWDQFKQLHMSELFLNRAPKNVRRVHLTGARLPPPRPLDCASRPLPPLQAIPSLPSPPLTPPSPIPAGKNGAGAPADAVDWTTKNAVTPVKNQQRCGSCWAFSTTGSVEGAYAIASGTLTSLSEQDLVSCDHNGDQGCNGGLMDNAFKWIESNGLCTEDDYPYTSGSGITGTCKTTCKPAVTITGFTDVPQQDETALQSALAQQPVSVAIEADKSAFQLTRAACSTRRRAAPSSTTACSPSATAPTRRRARTTGR